MSIVKFEYEIDDQLFMQAALAAHDSGITFTHWLERAIVGHIFRDSSAQAPKATEATSATEAVEIVEDDNIPPNEALIGLLEEEGVWDDDPNEGLNDVVPDPVSQPYSDSEQTALIEAIPGVPEQPDEYEQWLNEIRSQGTPLMAERLRRGRGQLDGLGPEPEGPPLAQPGAQLSDTERLQVAKLLHASVGTNWEIPLGQAPEVDKARDLYQKLTSGFDPDAPVTEAMWDDATQFIDKVTSDSIR